MSQEPNSRRGRRTANHDIADAPREGAGFSPLTQVAAEAAAAATTGPLPIVTAPSEPILSGTSRQAHLHRKPRSGWLASLMEHRGRFASFSVIGGGVFLLGLAMQVALVRDAHLDAIAAFFLQGFASVQVSFLLNHFWTWRAERVPFWQACWKFNVSKVVTTIANLILYAGLVRAGMNYVVANVATTAVFTVVNYIVGHYWAFSSKTHTMVPVNVEDQALLALDLDVEPQPWWPSVSVVVPCKNNPGTIRDTVDALLGQEYPALKEVILVGSTDDTTWTALADIKDPRLELLEQSPVEGFRDPAVKRDKGVSKSSGDVIAFADSDIVMQPRWLARGVAALLAQGGGVVAGGMRSIHDTFWGRFVDQNRLGAKTPRLPSPYIVTAENFGRHHRKPPVTANMLLTRDVYQDQPIDKTWMYGYEDYEWFWRIAKAGHRILFTDQLTGAHHHRRSFRHLVTEYRRAAFGCARFVRKHPDSPLAHKRRQQAFLLPLAGVTGLIGAGLATVLGDGLAIGAALTAGMVLLIIREFSHSRTVESLAYPLAGGALGFVFATSLIQGLASPGTQPAISGIDWASERRPRRVPGPLMVLLALQSALSLGLIWSNTASGDEALYLWAGRMEIAHWTRGLHLATNQLKFQDYFSGAPQLYPPLGALASSVGGLAGARILSLVFMLAATVFLYLTATRLFGTKAALIATALWVSAEPAMRMGAYATYDPMAISLICASVWVAVEASHRKHHGELVALAGLLLTLGSLVAYSYAIYVPCVIAVAVLAGMQPLGKKQAVISAAWLGSGTVLLLLLLSTVMKLWHGILFTTIARSSTLKDVAGSVGILQSAWSYTGLVLLISVAGAVIAIATAGSQIQTALRIMLIGSGFLVPLYQAFWAHTSWALDKHVAPGIWLAAIVGGCGIASVTWPMLSGVARVGTAGALLAFPVFSAWLTAYGVQRSWPNMSHLVAAVRPLARTAKGTLYGADYDPSDFNYYTQPESVGRVDWTAGFSLAPPGPETGFLRYYRLALRRANPAVVVLFFPGSLKSPELPGDVLNALAAPKSQQLARMATVNTKTPGLYDLELALNENRQYKIAASGPYDSGFGQFGSTPNTFVIWRHVGGAK